MEPPADGQQVLISQGAEARVFKCTFLNRPCVIKERFSKKYRHPVLDSKLTKQRVVQEARSLMRAQRACVSTPALLFVDTATNRLYMEFIHGMTVKAFLWSNPELNLQESVVKDMGRVIAAMHAHDIIHGDLTTSNFMLNSEKKLIVIDFGLSTQSNLAEDKAVDLYVLERAFLSSHPNSTPLYNHLLQTYEATDPQNPRMRAVISKLDDVRQRGRKKIAFG